MIPDFGKALVVLCGSMALLLGVGSFALLRQEQLPEALGRRVAAIEKAPVIQRKAMLERFWAERRAAGGPLVEPIGPGHKRVTFVYRGGSDTRAVQLATPLAGRSLAVVGEEIEQASQLRPIAGTDIWWIALDLRDTAAIPYGFAEQGDLATRCYADPLKLDPGTGTAAPRRCSAEGGSGWTGTSEVDLSAMPGPGRA